MEPTKKPRGSATLREVAAAAGVSITAVSKVLHGRGKSVRVSAEKATAIREAAEKLNYFPNAVARSLRGGRTHTVGLIFEGMRSLAEGPMFQVHLVDGVASELFKAHYRMMILPEIPTGNILSTLNDGRLDGVLWVKMPRDEAFVESLARSAIPVVALSTPPPPFAHRLLFVACDNESGSAAVARHLIELGHRRALFVMEHGEEATPDALARQAGFRQAMADLGCPLGPEDVVTWSPEPVELDAWWATKPSQTAIYVWNERLAGRVLDRAAKAGIRVPVDVSVVGFDSTPFCETTQPPLTAVAQPVREMAQTAASQLLRLIDGEAPEIEDHVFPCRLDVRASTGPARA